VRSVGTDLATTAKHRAIIANERSQLISSLIKFEMAQVTVVIPTLNGRAMLAGCLQSLEAQTYHDWEAIVVDNGSTDGTVEWLREAHPAVRVIANGENRGFAAAINQGIKAGAGRYVATLNNDAEAAPGWLAALVGAAESERTPGVRVGMCASKMLFADRPDVINSAGICVDRAGIAWDRLGGVPDDAGPGRTGEWAEVFGPCAGAALYSRAMLGEVGLLDPDFFAYMEDVDLAWRARRAGWRCLYVPEARVLHRHSATGREGSSFKSYHLGRNKVWLVAKNYPFGPLWHHVPLVLLYDLAAVVYALLWRHDVHALRGRLAGWAALPRMLARRTGPGEHRRLDLEWLEPLELPWRVSRRYAHLVPAEESEFQPRRTADGPRHF
jgi:GT2 family glycosyltransferase